MFDREKYERIAIAYAIGDFIACESFLTRKEKLNLKEIICIIKDDLTLNKFIYGNVVNIIKNSNCYNKNIKITSIHCLKSEKTFDNLDITLSEYFKKDQQKIKTTLLQWQFFNNRNQEYKKIVSEENIGNFCLMQKKLCDINNFKLPNNYISILGWTAETKDKGLELCDWNEIIKILKINKIKGVILNNKQWYLNKPWFKNILEKDCFINLVGKTNYLEAVEIVKKSNGFIGIDGSLSIIATQSLPRKSIIIKAHELTGAYRLSDYLYSRFKFTKSFIFNKINTNEIKITSHHKTLY